jgi:hypothetical protein
LASEVELGVSANTVDTAMTMSERAASFFMIFLTCFKEKKSCGRWPNQRPQATSYLTGQMPPG